MGKRDKKTGKGRLDKYYKLAKEQGYRARSAFKLIQLNKKFSFLESARCCIDLCAAPGGWLQVASKYMPVNSIIIGVDLVPIRPIPRVTSFPSDITSPQCRTLIRSHIKDWKADVVLHDGAPNVGTAWVQDAYTQSELVLSSLKLAVEFLRSGGTFVTKVFRSQDYNNLLWVFGQLFGKVEATKPPSSRNVSAEIFVVCQNYLAPAHIDPKFLDPRHVFKDVEALPPPPIITPGSKPEADLNPNPTASNVTVLNPSAITVFKPGKKVRHRDGYADDARVLFKAGSASQFVRSSGSDAINFLGAVNKIEFLTDEEREWYALEVTTPDVKANCDDLKVLGKSEFKALLKWRATIREEIGLDVRTKIVEELTETVELTEPVDEEAEIEDELERLNAEQASRRKRERKNVNEKKRRDVQRMQLRMVAPMDIGLGVQDQDLQGGRDADYFDLGEVEKRGVRTKVEEDEDEDAETSSDEDEALVDQEYLDSEDEKEAKLGNLETQIDGLYETYRTKMAERDTKWKVRESRRKDKMRSEAFQGIKTGDESDEEGDSEEKSEDEESEEGGWDRVQAAKARVGESESESESDSEDEDEDEDEDGAPPPKRRKTSATSLKATVHREPERSLVTKLAGAQPRPSSSKAAQVWFGQDVFKGIGSLDELEDDEAEEGDEDSNEGISDATLEEEMEMDDGDDDFEVVPQEKDDGGMWDVDDEDIDLKKQRHINKVGLVTAEAITLAQKLVNRQTTKTHLINDGFNRLAFNDKDGLPSWFLDDEAKYYKANVPVTKEALQMLRAKQRALDARPIKKVAEAKARKKVRAMRRIEKAVKKAEGVNESGEMNEKQKAGEIEKLMRKGLSGKGKQKREIKLVVAKGNSKGIQGRPKGVKGRYRMVDPRLKKELRAEKRKAKQTKKRKRT